MFILEIPYKSISDDFSSIFLHFFSNFVIVMMPKKFLIFLLINTNLVIFAFERGTKSYKKIPLVVSHLIENELKQPREIGNIAIVTAENKFSSNFHTELLKVLPTKIPRIIFHLNHHNEFKKLHLSKFTLVIFIADIFDFVRSFNKAKTLDS